MYLLDTNVLLFYLYDDARLSERARRIIFSEKTLFFSIASLWEIAIKASTGKLMIRSSISKIAATCQKESIELLPIRPEYLDRLLSLEQRHKDPFDRLILSTALSEKMTLISSDGVMPDYPVEVVW